MYGLWDATDTRAKASLDACNGHFGPVPANAEYGIVAGDSVYHYHTTDTPPYVVGCYGPVTSLKECSKLYQGCRYCLGEGRFVIRIFFSLLLLLLTHQVTYICARAHSLTYTHVCIYMYVQTHTHPLF